MNSVQCRLKQGMKRKRVAGSSVAWNVKIHISIDIHSMQKLSAQQMGISWISDCTPRITDLWATHYPRDRSLTGKFKLSDGTATAIFPRAISDASHRKVQNEANWNNMIQNATRTQYMSNISQSVLVVILLVKSYENSANYFMGQNVPTCVNTGQHRSTQQLCYPIPSLLWNLDTPRKNRFPKTNKVAEVAAKWRWESLRMASIQLWSYCKTRLDGQV